MVAKGHDVPGRDNSWVSIAADLGLHFPDFRAGERTFQLLTQVAGRAGRGRRRPGRVVIQTFLPHHYAIALARHPRLRVASTARRWRSIAQPHGYPALPRADARCILSGADERGRAGRGYEARWRSWSCQRRPVATRFQKIPDSRSWRPAPAPIARLRRALPLAAPAAQGAATRAGLRRVTECRRKLMPDGSPETSRRRWTQAWSTCYKALVFPFVHQYVADCYEALPCMPLREGPPVPRRAPAARRPNSSARIGSVTDRAARAGAASMAESDVRRARHRLGGSHRSAWLKYA